MIMTWDFYIIPKNIFNKLIWFSCDSLSKCYFKKGIHYWQGTFYRPERIQTNLVRCHGFVINKKVRVRLLLPCRTLTSFAYKLTLLFWHFFQDIEKPIFINGPTCPWYNPVLFFFFFNFYWNIVDLQCCIRFCYTVKWIICIHIHPLLFRFFSHRGHYRVLTTVPCAVEQVLINYLVCI